jgi:hypothetical protein
MYKLLFQQSHQLLYKFLIQDKIRELKERKKDQNNRINLTSSIVEGPKNTEVTKIVNSNNTSINNPEQKIIEAM